ncbi:hypothetical protein KUF71_019812 [Frankliniella fusca]|uniref:Reverse transcriptase domain-containing protein n=1 Tax=Frankliniella fusca TaxID=407009 RepID=A0AAE1GVS9_9NEOP|nr:hypothetical protein KUF71_019812 [Frankliniella fusca]
MKSTSVRLASLIGHSLYASGECEVQVYERGREYSLRFIVCETQDDFVPLLGREWLDAIIPEWRLMLGFRQIEDESQVKLVKNDGVKEEIEKLKKKYPAVFSDDDSSSIVGFTASVVLKSNCRPVFHKEYMVPYKGRYVRVERSEWASPMWPVPKPHSSEIRVVHDYKRTVNPCIVVDHYPLPVPVDIFNAMRGCKYYCLLDCTDAFMQLKLEEKSQEILVLNTCIGLLKPTRLPYGLASASACFQSVIDQILAGLKKTRAYIDDIIIGGESVEDCRQNLNAALARLEKHNVRVKSEKIKLYKTEIEILGYELGHNVYKPSQKKVNAIVNCAVPKNAAEVHSYVGMINFYGKFLPQASTRFKPLYDLLTKDAVWDWSERCEEALELKYRKSSQMGPADMLSRLPVKEYAFDETCKIVVEIPELPVSRETVFQETEADPQLSAVKSYILKGWPESCPAPDLKTYFDVRN